MLWKTRNQKAFGQVEEQGADTLNAIRHMVADIRCAYSVTDQASVRNKRVNIGGWLHPTLELAKLNVDGCSTGNPGAAGAGGLIWITWALGLRDSQLTITRGVHFGHGGVVGCDYWIGTCLVPWVATVNI